MAFSYLREYLDEYARLSLEKLLGLDPEEIHEYWQRKFESIAKDELSRAYYTAAAASIQIGGIIESIESSIEMLKELLELIDDERIKAKIRDMIKRLEDKKNELEKKREEWKKLMMQIQEQIESERRKKEEKKKLLQQEDEGFERE